MSVFKYKREITEYLIHFFSNASMIISIANINYRAHLMEPIDPSLFRRVPPAMAIISVQQLHCKIIVFKSGKCRIMGLKKPITQQCIDRQFPIKLKLGPVLSCTRTIDFQMCAINLPRLANLLGTKRAVYEVEIFPALRLTEFAPLCVNVFHTGKCVITGLKSTTINWDLIFKIHKCIQQEA